MIDVPGHDRLLSDSSSRAALSPDRGGFVVSGARNTWPAPTNPTWITANRLIQGMETAMASIDELTTAVTRATNGLANLTNVVATNATTVQTLREQVATLEAAQAGLIQPAALDPVVAAVNQVADALDAVQPAA